MTSLFVNAQFPLTFKQFDSVFIDVLKKSVETFISIKFPQHKNFELNLEIVYGSQKNEISVNTFPVDYIVNAEVWSFIMSASVNLTTPVWEGKNIVFSGIMYCPEYWNSNIVGNFYDLFYERVKHSFPLIEIDDLRFVYVKEMRGCSIMPIMHNSNEEIRKNVIPILERIAFSVYNEITNQNNMNNIVSSIKGL
jgi:hypothetical protein